MCGVDINILMESSGVGGGSEQYESGKEGIEHHSKASKLELESGQKIIV